MVADAIAILERSLYRLILVDPVRVRLGVEKAAMFVG